MAILIQLVESAVFNSPEFQVPDFKAGTEVAKALSGGCLDSILDQFFIQR
jgi:hypothetical protein